MARLIYSESAFEDLETILAFYSKADPDLAAQVGSLVEEAVQTLARHPLIGRALEFGLQELVISHGRTGFVALYDFVPEYDVARILALGHQREAGYPVGGGSGESASGQ